MPVARQRKTALTLRNEVLAQIFPSGTPESLAAGQKNASLVENTPSPISMMFDEAMGEVMTELVKQGLRNANTDVVEFARTYFKVGMTAVEAPAGLIGRVYTIADGNFDDPVFYTRVDWPAPEALGRVAVAAWQTEALTDSTLPALPLGFLRAGATTDRDTAGNVIGRARAGQWSLSDDRIWLAPWLQSNESLVIEWSGVKQHWADGDLVSGEIKFRKAVLLYMKYCHERDYGDRNEADRILRKIGGQWTGDFADALADVLHDEWTRQRRPQDTGENQTFPTLVQLQDDNPS